MRDYQSMGCRQCVSKHLANAMSYAKEVLAGHGPGGDPDHRPDLLGELCNAEHHLSMDPANQRLVDGLLAIRRSLEDNMYIPDAGMVTEMRRLWVAVVDEMLPDPGQVRSVTRQAPLDQLAAPAVEQRGALPAGLADHSPVDVLILDGNSPSELEGVRRMIGNLDGVNEVFEGSLPATSTEFVLVWPPHTGIIRKMPAGLDHPVHRKTGDGVDWACKPQVVPAGAWRDHSDLNKAMAGTPLAYEARVSSWVDLASAKVASICCGTKGKLRRGAHYVRWMPENWQALSAGLGDNMEWRG